MKRVVWVGLALFLLTMIGVPSARADSYKPAFTCNGNCSHSEAAFREMSFDEISGHGHDAAHRMSRWNRHAAFDMGNTGDNDNQGNDNDQGNNNDQGSNDQGAMGTPPPASPGSGMGPGSGSGSCGCSSSSSPTGSPTSSPTSSPTTAATPEPSSVILMLLGVGLLFLTRKRFLPGVRLRNT